MSARLAQYGEKGFVKFSSLFYYTKITNISQQVYLNLFQNVSHGCVIDLREAWNLSKYFMKMF